MHQRIEIEEMETTIASQITQELARLGISTDHDPCSGLTAEDMGYNSVAIYDDYDRAEYCSSSLLAHLKTLNPENVSLDSESAGNIWQAIAPFQQ